MRLGAAGSGWCAVRDARSAAWVCLPSINWMRCDCSRDWPVLQRRTPGERLGFARGLEIRCGGWQRGFQATRKRVCLTRKFSTTVRSGGALRGTRQRRAVSGARSGDGIVRALRCAADDLPHVWSAVRSEDGLGVCELCYHGATDEQIAACEMVVDPDDLESPLVRRWRNRAAHMGTRLLRTA